MKVVDARDPLGSAVVAAIRAGDLVTLRALLTEHFWLATARIRGRPECAGDHNLRSLLHVVTDWPGHFPNGAATVRELVAAGADPNARFGGAHRETPLHWAASCDDVEVLDALLEVGAAIDADGAVIGGGTALADATAFGQWRAARRLIEHGATPTFWEAAALGLVERVREHLGATPPPPEGEITRAFWGACHGGQLATAQLLFEHGADPSWVGWDGLTPLDAARRSDATDVVEWLEDAPGRTGLSRVPRRE